jgi:hypothetical protein
MAVLLGQAEWGLHPLIHTSAPMNLASHKMLRSINASTSSALWGSRSWEWKRIGTGREQRVTGLELFTYPVWPVAFALIASLFRDF